MFVVAESGVNHGGDIYRALDLCEVAKDCGADAVKFQLFNPELFSAEKRHVLRPLHLDSEDMERLAGRCKDIDIEFMATPFDVQAVKDLVEIGVKRIKVSAQSVPNVPLIEAISSTDLPVLMSNGMCSLDDLYNARMMIGSDRTTVMYCVSQYPTPDHAIDLDQIVRLCIDCNNVGYSSHSPSIWDCVAAKHFGATVIEKHIKLSDSDTGPDMSSSVTPAAFKNMVRHLRD